MAATTTIRSKRAQGPRVPKPYTRAKDARDEPDTRSSSRPYGSKDDHLLSKVAKERLVKAGAVIAAIGTVVALGLWAKADSDSDSSHANKVEACIAGEIGRDVHVGVSPETGEAMMPSGVSQVVIDACRDGDPTTYTNP